MVGERRGEDGQAEEEEDAQLISALDDEHGGHDHDCARAPRAAQTASTRESRGLHLRAHAAGGAPPARSMPIVLFLEDLVEQGRRLGRCWRRRRAGACVRALPREGRERPACAPTAHPLFLEGE